MGFADGRVKMEVRQFVASPISIWDVVCTEELACAVFLVSVDRLDDRHDSQGSSCVTLLEKATPLTNLTPKGVCFHISRGNPWTSGMQGLSWAWIWHVWFGDKGFLDRDNGMPAFRACHYRVSEQAGSAMLARPLTELDEGLSLRRLTT
jgi:hypothetical protein